MELSVPKGDFLAGQSVPLFIPSSVRRKWQIFGIDDECRAEFETEFADIRGYEFEWGQIVEELVDPAEFGIYPDLFSISACWHFVLVDLHNTFLEGGGNLGELSDIIVDILDRISLDAIDELRPERRLAALPDYISFGEGSNISAFEIDVLGAENLVHARKWVGRFFIPRVLPLLMDRLKEENRAASSPDLH